MSVHSAYLVQTFKGDRLIEIAVYSEPSPSVFGVDTHRLMIAKATAPTYLEAARHLEHMALKRLPPHFQKFVKRRH